MSDSVTTQSQSTHRGALYLAIALLTQASSDLASAFSANPIEVAQFYLRVTLAGLITWRAYIDKTPAQVETETSTKKS